MLLIIYPDALLIAPRRDVLHCINTLNRNDAPVCTDVTIVSTCSLTPMVDSIIVRSHALVCTATNSIVPTTRSFAPTLATINALVHTAKVSIGLYRRFRSNRHATLIACINTLARTATVSMVPMLRFASMRLMVSLRSQWYQCSRSHRCI